MSLQNHSRWGYLYCRAAFTIHS